MGPLCFAQPLKLKEKAMTQYQQYLKSTHWRTLRLEVLQRDGWRCLGCDCRFNLQVHHLTYKNLGNEPLCDLMVLCDECHKLSHQLLREMNSKIEGYIQRQVLRHFVYYARTPKDQRNKKNRGRRNHQYNKLPLEVREMVSRAKKTLKERSPHEITAHHRTTQRVAQV